MKGEIKSSTVNSLLATFQQLDLSSEATKFNAFHVRNFCDSATTEKEFNNVATDASKLNFTLMLSVTSPFCNSVDSELLQLTLQRAEVSTGYTLPSRSNLHF